MSMSFSVVSSDSTSPLFTSTNYLWCALQPLSCSLDKEFEKPAEGKENAVLAVSVAGSKTKGCIRYGRAVWLVEEPAPLRASRAERQSWLRYEGKPHMLCLTYVINVSLPDLLRRELRQHGAQERPQSARACDGCCCTIFPVQICSCDNNDTVGDICRRRSWEHDLEFFVAGSRMACLCSLLSPSKDFSFIIDF
ncbi:uncharacterized protein PHACADRAFT_248573 [Phanerochaete carnosa HHB-10118-sp]|uniref:Uncharacterized protein n=1 Tax=Phanerochaete carnosa (strain HHB-10118-sp) TaxID=650164 RepID=K5VFE8_PHACS|nr:uncharacterized protein PHACADRAFT_248573 [Phanerochaete carnosa HHB-10118-sp]EKM61751.1 hypothetical protein PHACADRAFT_248573 [Phanerochaete carnosa HHB-10118-sp]